ncbi:hypothetical protein SRABI106_04047 [Rahnella aquatilis]|nr:hypothetical protein SRABI106_04047 [Rahnella aquatilis]
MTEFQASEGQTGFGAGGAWRFAVRFSMVSHDVVFPLAVAGDQVINLCLAFKTETNITLVAVIAGSVREVMQTFHFTVQVQFIAVFIINFRCVCA